MKSFNILENKFIHDLLRNTPIRYLAELLKRRVIYGYNEFCPSIVSRRALFSYLVLPLLPPAFQRDRIMYSNHGIAQDIPRSLNELGYVVDIVNYDNVSWLPTKNYDLFIGHGGLNFERISRNLSDEATCIYFSTGIDWREVNTRVAKRLYEITLKKGYLFERRGYLEYSEDFVYNIADGIICLGNKEAANTYSKMPNVVNVNNAVFPFTWEGWRDRDYTEARKHFLFFSGRGNVRKGLYILLDAFKKSDLHLHICQYIEPDFARAYQDELSRPNIHLHGFTQMRSHKFESLAMRCNWIIMPTCAEGQPGGVIECMAYGLTPILSDAANIDFEDWGIKLPDDKVDTILSVIMQASQMNPEDCSRRTTRVVARTREAYMPENFRLNFKQAVTQIIVSSGRVPSTV